MYLPAQFTEIPVFFAKEFVSRASSLRFYFLRDGKVGQVTIFQFIYFRARARNAVSRFLLLC